MRLIVWVPSDKWLDFSEELLNYSIFGHVHYDQNYLFADPTTKKFTAPSVNAKLIATDIELFPIPNGYVSYDSQNDKYIIDFWSAFKDLVKILKDEGSILFNTGGMFAWYLCTRKGIIPSDKNNVDVIFPWGTETIPRTQSYCGAEWSQDIWPIGDRGQKTLICYMQNSNTIPSFMLQDFTDNLEMQLPFTKETIKVNRAINVDNAQKVGFTPLSISSDKVHAATIINWNCPISIYGTDFGAIESKIKVIKDWVFGFTAVLNMSVRLDNNEILNDITEHRNTVEPKINDISNSIGQHRTTVEPQLNDILNTINAHRNATEDKINDIDAKTQNIDQIVSNTNEIKNTISSQENELTLIKEKIDKHDKKMTSLKFI